MKQIIKTLGIATLLLSSASSHAVLVTFDGTISNFNPGPFSGGEAFSGSFVMDESVTATGSSIKTFSAALDSFTLTVGTFTFSGENGRIQQFSSSGGATDFLSLSLGGSTGTVSGNVGSFALTKVTMDWRGGNLFTDRSILAHDLVTTDFGYRRTTFTFSDTSTNSTAINSSSTITVGPLTSVPVPAAAWLFGSGLLGLAGIARRQRR